MCFIVCTPVMQYRKWKNITMQILAHFGMCLKLIFTTLMNFKKFQNVVLGFNITGLVPKKYYENGHVPLPLNNCTWCSLLQLWWPSCYTIFVQNKIRAARRNATRVGSTSKTIKWSRKGLRIPKSPNTYRIVIF